MNAKLAFAQYPGAAANSNLRSELAGQPDRKIPSSEMFVAAVDGQQYLRGLGEHDFYHGTGYWLQARIEIEPYEQLRLNLRSVFYSGSVSGGYTEPVGQYHLLGFTGIYPHKIAGGTLILRGMDLERQTFGQGLLIEDREMAGVMLKWSIDQHNIRLLKEGTGGLVLGDDLGNAEVSLFDSFLSGGVVHWVARGQSDLPRNRHPYYYLASQKKFLSSLGYQAEVGTRHKVKAGLFALCSDLNQRDFQLIAKLQGRFYEDDFGRNFVGEVQQQYISYDQYDKPFTNVMNVFVKDDNVKVYSTKLDIFYSLNQSWRLQSLNEVGIFDYSEQEDLEFSFYRGGVSFLPIAGRRDSITIFASNKVLTASYYRPPQDRDLSTRVMFKEKGFYGAEAAFRF